MTLEEIEKAVRNVRYLAKYDDEAANNAERKLHSDLLKAISEGTCPDPQACTKEAIKTANLSFKRWSA